MIRRLLPFVRPAYGEMWWGFALLLLASGLELLQPWPVKWLIDFVLMGHTPPAWLQKLWPTLGSKNVHLSVIGISIAIVIFATGHKLAQMYSQFLVIRVGGRVATELRAVAADHLHRLSLSYHDQARVGDMLYRAAYDTQAAQTLLSGAVLPIASGIVLLVGIFALMFRMDPALALAAAAMLPAWWIAIKRFGTAIESRSALQRKAESELACTLQESLSSIRAVKAFVHEDETDRQVRRISGDAFRAAKRLAAWQLGFTTAVGLLMAAGTAVVVGVGAERVLAGRLMPGDIIVFLAYLGMLYQPVSAFSQSAALARSARSQIDRVFEVLEVEPEERERSVTVRQEPLCGKIEFDNVSFDYEGDRPVLRQVSFHVRPGETVALVGRTGGGKTTVASLLLRFYQPTDGNVLIDGKDIRHFPLRWLRSQIALVLQDSFLFAGTVRENIEFGRPGADEDDIVEAARMARADEFISKLPDGYDTLLGERGVNLSGGQRQRLAIARAFLKDAPILILDEPTSNLDAHTESELMEAAQQLMRGRTTIIIAHRLSTVRDADTILVIEEGRVAEAGSHQDLLRGGGLYVDLLKRQTRTGPSRETVPFAMQAVERHL